MIERKVTFIQNFLGICKYSCSKNKELRNFSLYKEEYFFQFKQLRLKLGEIIKIECQFCKWKGTLPGNLARKIFRKGLRANTLIEYSANKLLSNYFVNFFAGLWWVFSLVLLLTTIFLIYKFYTDPIIVSEPEQIQFSDLKGGKYLGKIVRFSGVVDYSLAFTLDQIQETTKGQTILKSREVYLPVFAKDDPTSYILLRGGNEDLNKVLSKKNINKLELIRDQEYFVVGRVEHISVLTNPELRKFYLEDLVKSRSLTPTNILVSSVGLTDLNTFLKQNSFYYGLVGTLFLTSTVLQIYIDRKIIYK